MLYTLNWEKKNKTGERTKTINFKTYYKATVINSVILI